MKKVFFLFLSIVLFFLVQFSISKALPFNPVSFMSEDFYLFRMMPQGWAFFSRDPQEAQIQLYSYTEDKWAKVNHFHSDFSNLNGLKRNSARLLIEITDLFNRIERDCFVDCESNTQNNQINLSCLPSYKYEISNLFDNPYLCGDYLLVSQKITPWAWSSSKEPVLMPNKSIKLRILCSQEY